MRSVLDRVLPYLPQTCRDDFAALDEQGYACRLCFSVVDGRMLFCVSAGRLGQTYIQVNEEVEDALSALLRRVPCDGVEANT
jgi:hypothetical protein